MGWRTIRGSTGRAGVRAIKGAIEVMNVPGTVLAITPDGPRGPAGKVQQGVVFLARKSGMPILPVGIGMAHCWRANSWDRYRIPWPFSQVTWHYGSPLFVASEDDVEKTCTRLEGLINDLTEEATRAVNCPPSKQTSKQI